MFIDLYAPDWLDQLDTRAASLDDGSQLHLLIDGAFVPNLYLTVRKTLAAGQSLTLLFEALPFCSNDTRSVSPFLFTYRSVSPELNDVLAQCSGWPMISAIETTESLAALSARLSPWCLISNDQQRFNFRFPDTRQLPAMFAVLSDLQRGQMAGPARRWSFIGRDGGWHELSLPDSSQVPAHEPELDNHQFAKIVHASEADEILFSLKYRNGTLTGRHSDNYAIVSDALDIARRYQLPAESIDDWCDACHQSGERIKKEDGAARLASWHTKQTQN